MNKRLQDVVFTEILNRYNRYFISLIRLKFQEPEEVKDVYQNFSIFLYDKIGKLYPLSPDLFDTKSWLRTMVSNFCISELRKKNAIRQPLLIPEAKTEFIRTNYSDNLDDTSGLYDFNKKKSVDDGIAILFKLLTKREVLILKMKYYYNKPSVFISSKMNETHVDVLISRIKEKIKRKSGVKDIN
ncbi:MAG: sigma-70 family RNA polymerase sigma factor, partial [Crocinitomicaceae bacterium]|nr:sigma-70 family RNA polymerase sigma factor [Crocinitomicaceae bacterium]